MARFPLSRICYIVVRDIKLKDLFIFDFDNSGTLTYNSSKLKTLLTGYSESVPGSKVLGARLWTPDIEPVTLDKDFGPRTYNHLQNVWEKH